MVTALLRRPRQPPATRSSRRSARCGRLSGSAPEGRPPPRRRPARQASASALIRPSVWRMPSRSSPVNVSWPPSATSVSAQRDVGDAVGGLAALGDPGAGCSVGSRENDQIVVVVLDPERELAVRLEADHLRPGRPDQRAAPVEVVAPGAEPHRAADHGLDDLRAPRGHPRQVGDQRPHLRPAGPRPRWTPRAGLRFWVMPGTTAATAAPVGITRPTPRAVHQSSSAAFAVVRRPAGRRPSAARAGTGTPRRPRGPGRCRGSP